MVVLRHKELDPGPLSELAWRVAAVCTYRKVPWVLSHNAKLVPALRPDAIHLGNADPPIKIILDEISGLKGGLGFAIAVGFSAHSQEEIAAAKRKGAHYVWYAPVFDVIKEVNVAKGMGINAAANALDAAVTIGGSNNDFPVVFLGGINRDNISSLTGRGIKRIAAIGGLIGADDVGKAALELKKTLLSASGD